MLLFKAQIANNGVQNLVPLLRLLTKHNIIAQQQKVSNFKRHLSEHYFDQAHLATSPTTGNFDPRNIVQGFSFSIEVSTEMASFASAQRHSSNENLVRECFAGNTEAVNELLKIGACPNSEFDGWSPLAAASLMGHSDIVKVLLEHRAQVNMQCTNGAVALVGACANGHAELIK